MTRPPHPATVVQPKASPDAALARPPHPATVVQPKASPGAALARPPHPATVVQPKASPGAALARPPHPATRQAEPGSIEDRSTGLDASIQQKKGAKKGPKKEGDKKEKNKKSKVGARSNFEPDYIPKSTTVDTNFLAYASSTITSTSIDKSHYLNFVVTLRNVDYHGHINIKGGYALAHVTIAYEGRLVNYYYLVTGPGEIGDPESRFVSGGATEKNLSNMPSAIKGPITAMLKNIYG